MNSGEACIELAKIYGVRKASRQAAVNLLRRAVRMGRDDISDDARGKAKSLLKRMTTRKAGPASTEHGRVALRG